MDMLATAQDLMTPSAELLTVEDGTDWGPALADASERRYDIVPYREADRIAGIVRVSSGEQEPLAPSWLLSADTSMPDLLEILAVSDPAVRLVMYGDRVVGLVSAADLNKLPMRAYLYHVVGSLELAIATYVRREHHGDITELVGLLGERKREEITQSVETLAKGDVDVDPVQLFDLSDLITCVEKCEQFRRPLGYNSRRQASDALGGLNVLRNGTMHLVRPVIASVPEDLGKLRDRVARAWDLMKELKKLSSSPIE